MSISIELLDRALGNRPLAERAVFDLCNGKLLVVPALAGIGLGRGARR